MNALDKAIDDLGAVWSIGETIGYMIERDMLYKFEGHQPGYICTKREFESRVKERTPVRQPYMYGVEYSCDGQRPDLPDDVVVKQFYDGEWLEGERSVKEWKSWALVTAFKIVDERYKPKSEPSPMGFVGEKGDIYFNEADMRKAPDTDENFVPTDPSDMSRIDIIGQNGNTGEHYDKPTHPVTAVDFFTAGAEILNQRGQQYDSKGEAERSFPQVAQAFTAITGRQLSGSDVCLVLDLVKKIRQYAQPDRLHHDSLLDSVNYNALWAQELTRELTGGKP